MPSDVIETDRTPDTTDRVLEALGPRVTSFHNAVAAAEEEVRRDVLHRQGRSHFKEEQALVELGPFAIGRIDPERFAMLLGHSDTELTPEAIDVLQRADEVFRDFTVSTDVHRVTVEPGGDLRDAVKAALAEVGRLFGASRAVELARAGVFDPAEHGQLLGPLDFRFWNRAERHLAPPLVVEVNGDDCLPAGLGEFLDGSVTIVLVARGPTTPAPLARLITPGTLVVQTADVVDLGRVVESEHPCIALLFDEDRDGQAYFVHDPDGGETPWERLVVTRLPEEPDAGRGRRLPAWLEDVVHLRTLSAGPHPTRERGVTVAVAAEAPPGEAERAPAVGAEADQLAAWLLTQVDLSDL